MFSRDPRRDENPNRSCLSIRPPVGGSGGGCGVKLPRHRHEVAPTRGGRRTRDAPYGAEDSFNLLAATAGNGWLQ